MIVGLIWDAYRALLTTINARVSIAFTPRVGRPRDKHVERVSSIRVWLGVLLLAWATYLYSPWRSSSWVLQALSAGVQAPFEKAPIAFVVFCLATVFIYFFTPHGRRSSAIRLMYRPLLSAARIVLIVGAFVAVSLGSNFYVIQHPDDVLLNLILVLVSGMALLIAIPTLWNIARLGVKTSFNGAEGHPMLPALVGFGVSIVTIVLGARAEISGSYTPMMPTPWRLALTFGGAFVNGSLALWEISRLRKNGFSISE